MTRSEQLERLDRLAPWLLGALTFASCLAFMPEYPTEWDSIQLTFGVDHFDVTGGSPHPPGYWLYVMLGRIVTWLTPLPADAALSVLSAAAAGATVGLTYVIGRRFGGRRLGAAAALFLATSPFLLFYGATVSTYAFDALVATVLVLLAANARPGSWHGWAAAAALGLGAGLRQTTLIVLGPVALYAAIVCVRSLRAALAVAAAGALAVLAWFVPMIVEQPGGLALYRSFSDSYLDDALRGTSVFYGAPRTGIVNNLGQATGYTLAAVIVLLPVTAVAAVLSRRREQPTVAASAAETAATKRMAVLLGLVVGVSLVFVLLMHFGKAGYVLSYLPALALLLLWPLARLRGTALAVAGVLLVGACALDLSRFVFARGVLPETNSVQDGLWFTQHRHGAPYRLTRALMQQVDRETRAYLELADDFDPSRHAFVYVFLDGGHRFRHAAYTMPQFTMHNVVRGVHRNTAFDKHMTYHDDHDVEVPVGGEAVYVLDVPFPETMTLEQQGRIRPHRLDSGPTVWVVPPGVTMFGVEVVEDPFWGRNPGK
ncbi:MAG TPA: glycosyltransferase family 39 protein [Acidimicrobiales bacterium]|nr:glycosyltransferase family 39 protein [Acidimicrobiales bacterium]